MAVFTQEELEAIVMNTLTNLMVVVDYMSSGSDIPIEQVRESLLKNKDDLTKWLEAKE